MQLGHGALAVAAAPPVVGRPSVGVGMLPTSWLSIATCRGGAAHDCNSPLRPRPNRRVVELVPVIWCWCRCPSWSRTRLTCCAHGVSSHFRIEAKQDLKCAGILPLIRQSRTSASMRGSVVFRSIAGGIYAPSGRLMPACGISRLPKNSVRISRRSICNFFTQGFGNCR